ncbi:hypothetical protein EBT16_09685 [bacterium]|nr:hypothetical protein [bacterium]
MKIVVHDGRAHADDFLAACVCRHRLGCPVYRQPFDESMLGDSSVWILDQGRQFDPLLHNFDHHQIEEEICAFTMVLDHFYGKGYREYMPNLRYVEIFDSYGPKKAAEFAGIKEDSLDLITSPIHNSILKAFSKIEGEVGSSFLDLMGQMGEEICGQIEIKEQLMAILTNQATLFSYNGIGVLDTTACVVPEGMGHDQLPTKMWCKKNGLNPEVILNVDSRGNGYRMVSINTDSLKFIPNEKSTFTHNSGFLTVFHNLMDYQTILSSHVVRP